MRAKAIDLHKRHSLRLSSLDYTRSFIAEQDQIFLIQIKI